MGNSQKGKLKTSVNLMPSLLNQVKEKQRKEREGIFDRIRLPLDKETKKGRSFKAKIVSKEKPLKGFFPTGKRLYATWKGKDFKAWVFSSGTVKYKGRLYNTPTAAAMDVNGGKAINGWWFWQIKDDKGQLVRLTALRK